MLTKGVQEIPYTEGEILAYLGKVNKVFQLKEGASTEFLDHKNQLCHSIIFFQYWGLYSQGLYLKPLHHSTRHFL
jgi:hypothetical protein